MSRLKITLFIAICIVTLYAGADMTGLNMSFVPQSGDTIMVVEDTMVGTNLGVFISGVMAIVYATSKIVTKLNKIDFEINNVKKDVLDIKSNCDSNKCIANHILREEQDRMREMRAKKVKN